MNYLGDFPTGQTIYIYFNTFDSNDPSASVTTTGLAVTDIEIYKDGSTTQRSSDAGYTLLDTDGIDFDGITGIHGFSIDTSNNTDAGFFAAGSDYTVVVSSITVDAATINFIAASFSIDNRGLLRPTTVQRTLDVTSTGAAGIDWGNVENATTAVDLSGTDIQLCDTTTTVTNQVTADVTAVSGDSTAADNLELDYDGTGYAKANSTIGTCTTNTDMRGTDSAALASVCTESRLSELDEATSGKMANQVDIIQTDTTTDIPATISTAQADLDTLTGSDGVTLATSQPNYAPNTTTPPTVNAIADQVWDELQSGHVTVGSFGEIATEIASILTNTGALDTKIDTIDTVADAIKAVTDLLPNAGALSSLATAASVSGLNDLSAAQVNAEVLDVMNTDTFAEPGSVPAATATAFAKLGWLYALARNKMTQTSTTQTLRNDADSGDVGTSTHSDSAGTYTRGEWS